MTVQTYAEADYLFRHDVLRDAAYRLQMPTDRGQLHRAALGVIEEIAGQGSEESLASELSRHARHSQAAAAPEELAELQAKEVEYLQKAAEYAWQRHDEETAMSCYRRLAELPHAGGTVRVSALVRRATVFRLRAEFPRAKAILEEADKLDDDEVNTTVRARLWHEWGNIVALERDLAQANRFYDQARRGYEATNDTKHLGILCGDVGVNQAENNQVAEAVKSYGRAVELLRQTDDLRGLANMTLNLALCYDSLADYERAMTGIKEATNLARDAGDQRTEARALACGAKLSRFNGRTQEAEAMFRQAIRLTKSSIDPISAAAAYSGLGLLLHELGDLRGATTVYREGIAVVREAGLIGEEMSMLANLAIVMQQSGQLAEATAIYRRSIEVQRKLGRKSSAGIAQGNLATLYQEQGRIDDARAAFDEALGLLQQSDKKAMLGAFRCIRGILALLLCEYAVVEDDLGASDKMLPADGVLMLRLQCRQTLALRYGVAKGRPISELEDELAEMQRLASTAGFSAGSDVSTEIEKCARVLDEVRLAALEERTPLVFNGFLPGELSQPLREALLSRVGEDMLGAPALLDAMRANAS